jgi:hypothetical protein
VGENGETPGVEDITELLKEYEVTQIPFAMGGALVWVSSEGETVIDLVMSSPDDSLRKALLKAAGWASPPPPGD